MKKLRTKITHAGQAYVDEPVLALPRHTGTLLARSIASAFGKPEETKAPIVLGHERVRLRWVNPDGTPKKVKP